MKFLLSFLFTFFLANFAYAAGTTANILALNTASTSVTTSAFVQLSSSTPIVASHLMIANETTSNIIVAFGASGSEIGFCAIGPSSTQTVQVNPLLASAIRVSLKAVDATASSGWITVSLLP